ncbi:aldehyde dehydrogenase family 3 member F1-like isoform X1 [Eucalyptus grandis]|uniref:aldehyde dehydrogenase family 3 member F1-like isoform X1 n=1 Tax=Eucalyptus grandis TaxID=71139 RepID=UPI00192F06AE|nr:aldehyde dehydrogenase family 3 member F1-like isoform X1 [Eucalyptus grandis]
MGQNILHREYPDRTESHSGSSGASNARYSGAWWKMPCRDRHSLQLFRQKGRIDEGVMKMFAENPREWRSVARIENKYHFLRLWSLLLDPLVESSIVYGGSMDEESLFIEPTILMDPPLQAAIMMDEIFGPLLPIVTLNKIEDSIEFKNSRPNPFVIYVFTKDEPLRRSMVSKTSSGSIVFNDAIVQYLADTLPFGGIGESGMGRYHGKFSFDTFSHQKAVVRRSFLVDFWFRFPPWNDHKLQLFRSSYHYDFLGIVLTVLGLKRTNRASKGI